MDKVILHGVSLLAAVGVDEEERKQRQEVIIDLEITCDLHRAAMTDALADTVNYTAVHRLVKELMQEKSYHLIETMAEDIAHILLTRFPVQEVFVRVQKPRALRDKGVAYVGVEIIRTL